MILIDLLRLSRIQDTGKYQQVLVLSFARKIRNFNDARFLQKVDLDKVFVKNKKYEKLRTTQVVSTKKIGDFFSTQIARFKKVKITIRIDLRRKFFLRGEIKTAWIFVFGSTKSTYEQILLRNFGKKIVQNDYRLLVEPSPLFSGIRKSVKI